MTFDNDKIREYLRFIDVFKNMNNITDITEESLSSLVNETFVTFEQMCKATISEEEKEYVIKELSYKYQIKTTAGEVILADYDQPKWYTEIKDDINPKFWGRYKDYLIDEKHFNPNVISTLGDETLDLNLMDCLGNPASEVPFLKRGLIIGDVQSGKTSTYIGLMCKAADAGYKVFILLTGTIESLRQQTQERVEEGFIGIDMSADSTGGRRVGVGKDNKPITAMSMTSRLSDFTGKSDKIAVSLQNKEAIVFVIKKQKDVLQKLTNWLVTLNADPFTQKIDAPMLLIDDEADNASVNTSKEKEDPTTINRLIRELVSVFSKSNYVGFTATPFANVFIDPETTEDMANHDLFPEDFIVSLPTPSNYIGANKIFPEDAQYHSQLIYIRDCGSTIEDGKPFYFKHKKDWDDDLPESLTDAIYAFYLANAIRDLRGDIRTHRSMLVNMSRFIKVQELIKQKIESIHKEAYTAIKFHIKGDFESSMKNPVIKRLYYVWEETYPDCEFTWDEIANVLFESIESIQIKVVNSKKNSDKLVYPESESTRVIAIGGLALSRGLTLEGLITSYFYRNTSTYDVLMQMGRWFGYRRNYDDLFRIWTAKSSADWYAEISDATEKLKIDMTTMRDREMKPKTFGIRVRNDSKELKITANNKMRNTTDEYEYESYFGNLVETPYLSPDVSHQKNNFDNVISLVNDCVSNGMPIEKAKGSGEHYIIRNVDKFRIVRLLDKLSISKYSAFFDTEQLSSFISGSTDSILDKWDIAFMDGVKNDDKDYQVDINGNIIYKVRRDNCEIDKGDRLKIGQKGKLGGPSDGLIGIFDDDLIVAAKTDYEKDYLINRGVEFKKGMTYPSDTWFKFISDRNPLLMIYFVKVNDEKTQNKANEEAMKTFKAEMGNTPATAFAIGFPKNNDSASVHKSRYKVNVKYNYFEQYENENEGEEE